ncbi:hypothetical protein FPSE_08085 [Fusarium pseudograminearum CS3096]|uniref:Uncharacterized protein n=1 Tax=Fusarium pseudograminearum (strain CS3096) TaxID=1028729 RepID=K3VD17_FUSPC|nr:hypothetical protein FPSE_08085 [Fusarium pseudograminearum CS3096]EKJ71639.1 hypothetical protein FPSE_08085 [Fusarium pseudograminearum CS3096]
MSVPVIIWYLIIRSIRWREVGLGRDRSKYFCWWLLVEVYNQCEIFDIERPDETNRRYLPLIREKKYCDAMRPSPLKTSGDDSEGQFQVIDDVVETESQPQAIVELCTMTDPTNEETLRASVNEVLRPAAYGSYGTSSKRYATARNTYEATSDRTTSVPDNSSISTDMPTEQDEYQKRQDYQNDYERGYDEGYKSGYQEGIDAVQGSTVYDEAYNRDYSRSSYGNHNHEVANADTQDYPYRGSFMLVSWPQMNQVTTKVLRHIMSIIRTIPKRDQALCRMTIGTGAQGREARKKQEEVV